MPLTPGTRLGPYEIAAVIGAGGMGEVYRAHDSRLNRDVAIKTLPAAFAEDGNRLARFQREAQVLAALSHPNIAGIHGLEQSAGTIALVMEFVDGPTLAEQIAGGPIAIPEALAIARQISAALEAAHEKGIIHRDLKPANIKLTAEGQVKVLDFGLAKAMGADSASGSAAASVNSPTLTMESTRAGVILGTAAYMSPEQARGRPVDKRADIWAFGVVLFEMLTGHMLFQGETVSDTLAGVLRADLDWTILPADTPPAVRRLLERCLQRDAKKRLRDIGDAWFEIDSPPPAAAAPIPAAPTKNQRLPWIACGAAVLIAAAAIAWAVLHKPAEVPRQVVRWSYSQEKLFYTLGLSREGSRLAYSELDGTRISLALRPMDQPVAAPVPDTDRGVAATFSPDGQWMVFADVGDSQGAPAKLKKKPVTGGTAVTLCDVPDKARGIAWGDNGDIVFDGGKGLMRISSSGGAPEQVTTVDSSKHEIAHSWPYVMPGSRTVLFRIRSASGSQVALLDLKSHVTRVLIQNGSSPRYASSGHLIYYRDGTLFAAPFDAARLELAGPEAPVVEDVASVDPDGADYSISDQGLLVYMTGGGRGLTTILNWADRKGKLEPVSDAKLWGTGRLSPDMTHVANTIRAGEADDIWTYDLTRRTALRLTFEGKDTFPIWSPDGRWITFVGIRNGHTALYRVKADASGKPELLAEIENAAKPNSWSPDGKTLVFSQSDADKHNHLWLVAIPGGKPVRLHDTDTIESDGEVSPDGRWLAYESSESGDNEVYVQPFPGPGPKTRISTEGGFSPRWSHSGKEIFYWNALATRQLLAVRVQPGVVFGAGLPQFLFQTLAGTTWDVASDGERFLVETPASTRTRRMEGVVNWFEELNRRVPVKR
jgi:serine/threonine-protein kinase